MLDLVAASGGYVGLIDGPAGLGAAPDLPGELIKQLSFHKPAVIAILKIRAALDDGRRLTVAELREETELATPCLLEALRELLREPLASGMVVRETCAAEPRYWIAEVTVQ